MQELLARVQSLLRRPQSYIDNKLYIGDILLDTTNKVVTAKNVMYSLERKNTNY
jgi:DNA-binding response OmpR family regulator